MGKRYDIIAMSEAMVEFNQTTLGQPTFLQGFGAVAPLPQPEAVYALLLD